MSNTADTSSTAVTISSTTTPFRIRPSIVLFGDSITQQAFSTVSSEGGEEGVGWASLLASAYSRRADVLNRGFSGYNTQHALQVLPRIFGSSSSNNDSNQKVEILFCTVFFGANDAALPGDPQHVDIDQYRDNLQTIVTSIRRASKRTSTTSTGENDDSSANDFPIILCTPPPVCEEMWAAARDLSKSNRTNKRTHSYGSCVKQVAAMFSKQNCAVLDVWELLQGGGSGDSSSSSPPDEAFRQYLSDGLHLSELGNRKVYEGLMDWIRTQYPHLHPMLDGEGKYGITGVPLEEPLWKELCGLPL